MDMRTRVTELLGIRSGVRGVETAGNTPKAFFEKMKRHGIRILHKCTSVRYALSAERNAEDVNMGTRFCATREASIHDNIKQALVRAGERETRLIFRSLRNTPRMVRNVVCDSVVATENRPGGCMFEGIRPLVSGQRGRAALETGEVDSRLVWAGLVVGLIDDVPTCGDLIERMVAERKQLAASAAFFAPA